MSFLFLAVHYPHPNHRADLLGAMERFGKFLVTVPGMIEAHAWSEVQGERIVATSIWETPEACVAAMPAMGEFLKDIPFEEWEAKPRELSQFTEAV